MKRRFIAMLVAAIMVLSMIPAMSFTASAAVEGDWDTFRSGDDYDPPEEGEEEKYVPAGGYEYTSEGFVMIPADYSNTTPFVTVQSKEKQAIKDGVYMEFRVDDYSYSGEDGQADNWICLTIWDGQKPVPGNTKHGSGWLCLIRDNAGFGGAQTLESFNVVPFEEGVNPGAFNHLGSTTSNPPEVDDQGKEHYTVEITHDGTNYDIKICGVSVAGATLLTSHLDGIDPNGDFYIGVTMMSTVQNGTAAMSILKYGTSASDATTPVGDDSKEPEENPNQPPAPIADPSTVEVNQPCIIYNASTVSNPNGGNMEITPMGDDSFHILATQAGIFTSFGPKRAVSYSAQDFPIVGVLIRNCWASTGAIWYYSGDVVSANGSYQTTWSPWDGEYFGEDEEYSFVTIDLTGMWAEGRINGLRLDFNNIDLANDAEFDLCWVGHFRSVEEAEAYNLAWMTEKGIVTEGGDEEDTTEAAGDDTTADDTTADDTSADDTTADTTPAGDDTTAATGDATSATTEPAGDTGCFGVVGMGAASILVAAAAAVALRKKH